MKKTKMEGRDIEHITVLRNEAVQALAVQSSDVIVDATLGAAGHSCEIVGRLGVHGTLVGIDADIHAVEKAKATLLRCTQGNTPRILLENGNFRNIHSVLLRNGIGPVNGVLADLGWRQEQFGGDQASGGGKGFSFRIHEPLLMTYGDPASYTFTAKDIVNDWDQASLEDILSGYGEERYARSIAKNIVAARDHAPILTTTDLIEIIEYSVPSRYRFGGIHPATRTFQALRIAVNDELGALEIFIQEAVKVLAPGGKLAIITFHSLEDRIVKVRFRELEQEGKCTVVTKRPIVPSEEEIAENPRARSAKLRVLYTNY